MCVVSLYNCVWCLASLMCQSAHYGLANHTSKPEEILLISRLAIVSIPKALIEQSMVLALMGRQFPAKSNN